MSDLIAIGYWESSSPDQGDLPQPSTLVRPGWELERRTQILEYLRGGAVYVRWRGSSHCRFECGAKRMGSKCLTDGRFVWPEGLWHYVEAHDVMLPGAFITHMASHDFFPARGMVGPVPTRQTHLPNYTFWIDWVRSLEEP